MNSRITGLRAAALAALLLCLPAHATTQWLRIRSNNFEMLTTAGEKKGREAILYFEAVRKFFEESKMFRRMPTTPVRIVAFRSAKEYKPYAAKEFADAYYQPGFEHDYIVMSNVAAEDYPAAIHEYMHLLIEHTGVKIPLWLNEGLADLFSSLQPRGKKLVLGALLPGRLEVLRETRPVPLELITSADEKSPFYNESNRASIFYAESWALVHMLFLSPEYRPKFDAFINTLARRPDAAKAFETVYGKSMPEIQKELHTYFNGSRFIGVLFNLQLDTKSEDPDVDTMPAWDAQFALAEIMSASQEKQGAGRMMLEQLAREDPKRWEPEAALGELDLRRNDNGKAGAHFERAAQLGAKDPEMYFRYGIVLRESGDRKKSVAMLRKSAELKPDYEDAHFFLGFEYMDASQFGAALAEFTQVKHVTAENAFSFFSSVAYANYRLNQKDAARSAVAHASQYARDGVEREHMDQLLAALDERAIPQESAGIAAAPQIRRRLADENGQEPSAASVPPEKVLPSATGQFVELACEGETARMGISSNGKLTWFLMDDPHAIAINSASGPTADLTCGTQKPRKVTVHYVASSDAAGRTAGLVRAIDFE